MQIPEGERGMVMDETDICITDTKPNFAQSHNHEEGFMSNFQEDLNKNGVTMTSYSLSDTYSYVLDVSSLLRRMRSYVSFFMNLNSSYRNTLLQQF